MFQTPLTTHPLVVPLRSGMLTSHPSCNCSPPLTLSLPISLSLSLSLSLSDNVLLVCARIMVHDANNLFQNCTHVNGISTKFSSLTSNLHFTTKPMVTTVFYPKRSDRFVRAHSVNIDQTALNERSDQVYAICNFIATIYATHKDDK